MITKEGTIAIGPDGEITVEGFHVQGPLPEGVAGTVWLEQLARERVFLACQKLRAAPAAQSESERARARLLEINRRMQEVINRPSVLDGKDRHE